MHLLHEIRNIYVSKRYSLMNRTKLKNVLKGVANNTTSTSARLITETWAYKKLKCFFRYFFIITVAPLYCLRKVLMWMKKKYGPQNQSIQFQYFWNLADILTPILYKSLVRFCLDYLDVFCFRIHFLTFTRKLFNFVFLHYSGIDYLEFS